MTGTVKLTSAGGGSVSLVTPSTGSNRTVTLPDATVTIPATNSSTTLTTQGDILYRDGSGLQRLAKGSAGHVLKMNSGANAPEWAAAAAGGKILQYVYEIDDTSVTTSGGTEAELLDLEITPAHADNKILILASVFGQTAPSSNAYATGYIRRGSVTGTILFRYGDGHNGNSWQSWTANPAIIDHPNTTSAQEYTLTLMRGSSNTNNVQTDGNKYSLALLELAA